MIVSAIVLLAEVFAEKADPSRSFRMTADVIES
jgi:hypothetical protein